MKQSLLVLAVGALVATTANAGLYVQGDLGYSKFKVAEFPQANKAGLAPSLSVGYQMNDWRVALDYTKQPKINFTYTNKVDGIAVKGNISTKINSIGLSAAYDFNLNSPFTPYVSARVSLNKLKLNDNYKEYNDSNDPNKVTQTGTEKLSKTKVGYGVGAGIGYALNKNIALNAGVEYNYLGNFDGHKVKQYGAKLGLRYHF